MLRGIGIVTIPVRDQDAASKVLHWGIGLQGLELTEFRRGEATLDRGEHHLINQSQSF